MERDGVLAGGWGGGSRGGGWGGQSGKQSELESVCIQKSLGGRGVLLRVGRDEGCIGFVVWRSARRTQPVEIVLDVSVAEEADLVAALARTEVPVRHVHLLQAKWAACAERGKTSQSCGAPQKKGCAAGSLKRAVQHGLSRGGGWRYAVAAA